MDSISQAISSRNRNQSRNKVSFPMYFFKFTFNYTFTINSYTTSLNAVLLFSLAQESNAGYKFCLPAHSSPYGSHSHIRPLKIYQLLCSPYCTCVKNRQKRNAEHPSVRQCSSLTPASSMNLSSREKIRVSFIEQRHSLSNRLSLN